MYTSTLACYGLGVFVFGGLGLIIFVDGSITLFLHFGQRVDDLVHADPVLDGSIEDKVEIGDLSNTQPFGEKCADVSLCVFECFECGFAFFFGAVDADKDTCMSEVFCQSYAGDTCESDAGIFDFTTLDDLANFVSQLVREAVAALSAHRFGPFMLMVCPCVWEDIRLSMR